MIDLKGNIDGKENRTPVSVQADHAKFEIGRIVAQIIFQSDFVLLILRRNKKVSVVPLRFPIDAIFR